MRNKKFKIGQEVFTLIGTPAGVVIDSYSEIVITRQNGNIYRWVESDLKDEE